MGTFTLNESLLASLNILPRAIYDAFPAVLFGRMLVISTRLGVFDTLDEQAQTCSELARRLKVHPKGMALICDALTASHYLKKHGEKYSLSAQSKKWLVQSSPSYLGNFFAYIDLLYSHWLNLEETLKQGKPPTTYVQSFNENEWKIYTSGMMDLAKLLLPYLIPKIDIPVHARSLLDVGGSHGLYAMEVCKRHPLLHATIADFPQVLAITQQFVHEHHVENRVALMPCDLTTTAFEPEKYDVVFVFNIVHGFNHETNKKLFSVISSSLKPQGVVYIMDQFKESRASGVRRLLPLMVGLNLLNEIGGNVYTFQEIKAICTDAGLSPVKLTRLITPGVSLITAKRG